MVQICNVTKSFGRNKAVNNVSFEIQDGSIFGLVGSNGAGKSTLLRMMAGILRGDQGEILVEGEKVYENPAVKEEIFYISDQPFFFPNGSPLDMEKYFMTIYPRFDKQRFEDFLVRFHLGKKRKIDTYSKGMKRQLAMLLGICSNTKYIFFDETFDGLDPVMRRAMKGIIAGEVESRNLTPVIAFHNLRELEDICDHIGLLHQGGVLLSRDLEKMKSGMHKVQCVLSPEGEKYIKENLKPLKMDKRGSLLTAIVKGETEKVHQMLEQCNPTFYEILPLSLEEIFICETEVEGYDIKNFIF